MNLNFDITLTKSQEDIYNLVHNDKYKYVIAVLSRQCGKSTIAEILCIEYLFKANTFNGYITPTFSHGRKVFKELVNLLADTKIIKSANATTLTIETIFNSTLQFFSTEAYVSIRGNTITGILILDEAAYFPTKLSNGEDIWSNVISPICKNLCKKVLVISTPFGTNGFFYNMYMKSNDHRFSSGRYTSIIRTIYDDPLISKEAIEEIKEEHTELSFRQEYLCEFLSDGGSYFNNFEQCFKNKIELNNNKWIGVDFSAQGKDETILTIVDENLNVKQHKILGNLDDKYNKIANIINTTNNLQGVYMEDNGIGSVMINEVTKLVEPKLRYKCKSFTTNNSNKESIITYLALILEKNELSHDSFELNEQFKTFISKLTKNRNLQFEAKSGFKDDMVMSLAIALECKNKMRTYSKSHSFINNNINKIK